jgi:hypothetical protein
MFGFKWFGHQQLLVFFRANLHLLLRGHLFEGSFLFHNVIVCPSQDSPVYCITTILLKISGLFTFLFEGFSSKQMWGNGSLEWNTCDWPRNEGWWLALCDYSSDLYEEVIRVSSQCGVSAFDFHRFIDFFSSRQNDDPIRGHHFGILCRRAVRSTVSPTPWQMPIHKRPIRWRFSEVSALKTPLGTVNWRAVISVLILIVIVWTNKLLIFKLAGLNDIIWYWNSTGLSILL